MTTDRERVAARLAFVAGGVSRRLRPRGGELSHVALSALATVERSGSIRPSDLARIEGVTAPGVTRLLDGLEQRGLVERAPDPDDGRAHRVALTATGAAELESARLQRALGALDLLAGLSDEAVADLEPALRTLESALVPQMAEAR